MQALSLRMPLEPPVDARELGDWFRALKEQSGLSFAAIARELGEEERNVKRWMPETGQPTVPSGDVVLRLITVLGVKMIPPPPVSVAPLHLRLSTIEAELGDLIARLTSAAAERPEEAEGEARSTDLSLEQVSALAAEGLARVEAGIARVEQQLAAGEPQIQIEERPQ